MRDLLVKRLIVVFYGHYLLTSCEVWVCCLELSGPACSSGGARLGHGGALGVQGLDLKGCISPLPAPLPSPSPASSESMCEHRDGMEKHPKTAQSSISGV